MPEGKPKTLAEVAASSSPILAGIIADVQRGLDGLFHRRELTPEEIERRAEWAQAEEHEARLASRRDRYGRERRALSLGCSLAMLDILERQEARIEMIDKRIERLDAEVRHLWSARR